MSCAGKAYIIRRQVGPVNEFQRRTSRVLSSRFNLLELGVSEAKRVDFSDGRIVILDFVPSVYSLYKDLEKIVTRPFMTKIPVLSLLPGAFTPDVLRLHNLGISNYLIHPRESEGLLSFIDKILDEGHPRNIEGLNFAQSVTLKAVTKLFRSIQRSDANDSPDLEMQFLDHCELLLEALASQKISDILLSMRSYHRRTYAHSVMVAAYLAVYSLLRGIQGSEFQDLVVCGLLHDVGKMFTPIEILGKPGKLDDHEWLIMQRHSSQARKALLDMKMPKRIVLGAEQHHEKINGTGYPFGLKGGEISKFARLVAVADVFSSLTESRSYKKRMDKARALEQMKLMDGHLDQEIVSSFAPIVFSSDMALSNSPVYA